MENTSRRHFLKTSSLLLGMPVIPMVVPKKPLLSFSTLGCPAWSFDKIIQCAIENGYQGLEIRGILGELNLPKISMFSPEQIASTRRQVADAGLQIINLGSSANMHFIEATKRKSNLDDAKKFIELAQMLNCPFVRVFPNDLPKDQNEAKTVDIIIQSLQALGEFAEGSGVKVLLESHGKVIQSDMLLHIMQCVNHAQVGLVWDYFNMWSVTKEDPSLVYTRLKKYILHTHIKDANMQANGEEYTLIGQGNAPLHDALHALKKGGYEGYYSFEWEKLWHPEIPDPSIAIPHFAKNFRKYWV
jgi:sugar phosphate isomerase/epimerase